MKDRLLSKPSIITIFILIAIMLVIFPHLVVPYYVHISIRALWYAFICVAWTFACRASAVNLCHSTFIGIGAYTSTLLFVKLDVSPWLGILPGMAIALLAALLIGWICFRVKLQVISFVLVTLAFAVIIVYVIHAQSWAGGSQGFRLWFTEDDSWNFQWVSKLPYYYIILAMTFFIVVIFWLVDRSKIGIYFKAIAENERGAAAIGIDVMRYKLIAIGISAIFAAIAGTFWAQYSSYVEPDTYLSPELVLTLLVFNTIGGVHSRWGPVVAPLLFIPLLDIIRGEVGSQYVGATWIFYGSLVVLITIFLPRGVMTWVEERLR